MLEAYISWVTEHLEISVTGRGDQADPDLCVALEELKTCYGKGVKK